MSEHTGLSISQVTDEVLYTSQIEMQELWAGGERTDPDVPYIKWLLAFMPRCFLRCWQRLTSVNGAFFGLQQK